VFFFILLLLCSQVVIWEQNHGTNNQAWFIRQAQRPFVIKTVPSEFNGASTDDEIVDEFTKLVNAHTKFVTFSHLSNVGGRLLPGEKICKAVHATYPNCHVHIDGAMTWGCMNLNLVQMDCDR
jgi:selenocysteine lyase/cysteine desulfurase